MALVGLGVLPCHAGEDHEDANGNGVPLEPGSYVRQAGGEMHVDRCVSKEPCLLFLFQYSRADVILPAKK